MVDVVEKIHELADELSPRDVYVSGASYDQIQEVLDAIHDQQPTDIQELEFEGDVYSSDLLDWLGEDLRRAGAVDDVLSDFGGGIGLFGAIQMAQVTELEGIAYEVWTQLEEMAEQAEEEGEE